MSVIAEAVQGREFGQGALPKAVAVALLLECLMVGSVVWWLVYRHEVVPAAVKAPMHISLVTLAPAKPRPTPPKPAPVVQPKPKPQPKPQPKPKPVPRPTPKPVHHHVHHPKPKPVPKPVTKPAVTPPVAKAPPPPPPQPVQAVSASPDEMALFSARIKAAVQAAVRYPPAARMMHRQGQARVAFDYLDGKVSQAHLVQSSGFPMLDRAAVAAVNRADYPMPLAKLAHRLMHMSVWVQFREVDDD